MFQEETSDDILSYYPLNYTLPPHLDANPNDCRLCKNPLDETQRFQMYIGFFICQNCHFERMRARQEEKRNCNKRKSNEPENNEMGSRTCTNCYTSVTTNWRRNKTTGQPECNSCWLFYRNNKVPRPISMRRDRIKSRKRKPKASQASKVQSSPSSKKSTSESNSSPQYMPNEAYDISNYTLPTYNTLQMRDFSSSVNNAHHAMLPPINSSQPFQASKVQSSSSSKKSTSESTNPNDCRICRKSLDEIERFQMYDFFLCQNCYFERVLVLQEDERNCNKRKMTEPENKENNEMESRTCTNCHTSVTTNWRRNKTTDRLECNSCWLFYKNNKVPRPKHMRKDTIQSRTRKPKVSQATKVQSSSSSKQSTSESNLSPQYMPNEAYDISNYTLLTYNTLQMRDFSSSVNNAHHAMLPPINSSQPFQASKVQSSSSSKKSTNLSPQYMPNEAYDISNYTLPTYNTLQMRDISSSVNNTHHAMLPPINSSQPLYAPCRPETYNIYNSVPPNEIINIPSCFHNTFCKILRSSWDEY